jgi:GNAT superfamily N-acetyltransferase
LAQEWSRDGFVISTDKTRLDLDLIHGFLTQAYWSRGVPREVVARAILGSMCFGVYEGAHQVGFARVTTDRATFGYIGDVFILEDWRGRGLGEWLMQTIMAHPELQGFRRWLLATLDAHGLYAKLGFTPLAEPGRYMEKTDLDIYVRQQSATR